MTVSTLSLDEMMAAQYVESAAVRYEQAFALTVPNPRIYLPDPPNHAITTYPDPGILPDRYAYGTGGGIAPQPATATAIPSMILRLPGMIPFGTAPGTNPQLQAQLVIPQTLSAPVPRFTNVES